FDLRLLADVRLDTHRLAPLLLDLVQHLWRVAFIMHLIEHYPCALTCEHPRDARPCPAHGAGDERDFALSKPPTLPSPPLMPPRRVSAPTRRYHHSGWRCDWPTSPAG